MNQCERIAEYIKEFGSITTLEAFNDLGITRLASRIHDLTEAGYRFEREHIRVKTRTGEFTTVTRYRFKGAEE